MAASPGVRWSGRLALAHELQALAAREADAADEQQRAAADGDQDAAVDAVAVSHRRLAVDRRAGDLVGRTWVLHDAGAGRAAGDLVGRAQVLRVGAGTPPSIAGLASAAVGEMAAAAMPATTNRLNLVLLGMAPPGR